MPHISDPKRRELLFEGFPACRPTGQTQLPGNPPSCELPPTQPLRVVVARAEAITEGIRWVPRETARTRREQRRQGTQRTRSTTPYTTGRTHRGILGNLGDVFRSLDRITEEVEQVKN